MGRLALSIMFTAAPVMQYFAGLPKEQWDEFFGATFDNAIGTEEHSGIHALNIHRANSHRASTVVGKWSAGCQVFQDPDHFLFLLSLCEKGKERFGNSFTYTLLEEGDL